MHAGAMYAWRWLKQLTQMKERRFSKSTQPLDSTEREDECKSDDVLWTFSDLFLITCCFQIDIIYLCNMGFILKDNHHAGFLQIMIMFVTWGPALIYMEIFLGQYVQRGCLHLKNMSPLTCSTVGYAMLLIMYCYTIATVGRLADSYMFLFRSFSSELPWMVCPKGSTPDTCIDRALLVNCYLENKKDNCYPKLGPELLSTRIYYKATHSVFTNRAALLLFGWFTIYIALKRTLSDARIMVRRLLLFILVLFLCLLTPLMAYVSLGLSVVPFFTLSHSSVISIGTWIVAFKRFLMDHAVVRGGWQLIGSHIKRGPAAANLTIYSCAVTYLVTVVCQIFSTGILGVLFFYMKILHVEEELHFPKYTKLFSFYPFALGLLQVRQMWSLIFFALVAISSMSYTIVNMVILEESMYDNFPVLMRYRSYVKVILCVLGFIIGVVNSLLTGADSYEDDIMLKVASQVTQIVVLILTFSVGYIYGMERFSDDMNFLNGSQPTTYWKICWMSLPFGILILIGGDMIAIKFPRNNLAEMTSNIVYVILLSLAVLRMLYQVGMSIKARNVTGILFQATPLWGPPLPEDRRLRHKYNPREETKYWRKSNLCTHHCLLNKDFITSVIFREIDSRTSRARNADTLQHDFVAIPKQSKRSQVVIAIDKVSSAQLETFEDQVAQKLKTLEDMEEAEIKFHRRQGLAPKKRITVTQSMEELENRIDQMTKQAKKIAELETANDVTKVQRSTSRTKQRRLPTFLPKETPRPTTTRRAPTSANRKGTKNTNSAKIHTYAVKVPRFILRPSDQIRQDSALPVNSLEKVNLRVSKSSLSRKVLFPKSTTCKASRIQTAVHKPTRMRNRSRLPVWPVPRNTPRPTVSPRLSRSSSSTSTVSWEPYRRSSAYFLSVRLPPRSKLPLPAFSVDFPSPPRSRKDAKSSSASLELSLLNHDPVLRKILRAVHPQQFPVLDSHTSGVSSRIYTIDDCASGSERREVSHPQPVPRTSIARRSPSIYSPAGSPCFPLPLPRKQKPRNSPVASPRPRPMRIKPAPCHSAFGEEAVWPKAMKKISDASISYEKKGASQTAQTDGAWVPAVDIDQAIQIRIDNLLRGVRNPEQRSGSSAPTTRAKNVSKGVRDHRKVLKISGRETVTPQTVSEEKKISSQPVATSCFVKKISALGNKVTQRIKSGSTSRRLPLMAHAADANNKQPDISTEEKNIKETELDFTMTGFSNTEQPSASVEDENEICGSQEQADRKD